MSDFDREAEREKLREQFAEDDKKREASERMSELLLKGATMTNKHCDACGDPIFRHEGQEFCPTCHTQWEGGNGASGQQPPQGDQPGRQPTRGRRHGGGSPEGEAGDAAHDRDATDGVTSEGTAPDAAPADPTAAAREAAAGPERPPDRTDVGVAARTDEIDDGVTGNNRTRDRSAGSRQGGDGPADGDLAAARASLERSLAALARRAEAAEDLSEARTYLAAAREAAEALDAAERVGR